MKKPESDLDKSSLSIISYYAKCELAKRNYADYFTLATSMFNPRGKLYAHTKLICDKLQKIIDGEQKFYIVEMPPQHGKSMTITETFPSYFMMKNPDSRVVLSSYSDRLVKRFGAANLLKFNTFGPDMFDLHVSKTKHTSNEWNVGSHDGSLFATTILGQATGFRADLMIVDDPFSGMISADSPIQRQKVWEAFISNFATRRSNHASMIVIMTRWNVDDLPGRLLKAGDLPWEEIRLPALAEENDPLGRKPGETLCPEVKSQALVESQKELFGNRMFNAIYQQRPVKQGGNIFKETKLHYYVADDSMLKSLGERNNNRVTILPDAFDKLVTSWDLTFSSSDTSDYVAGQTWGIKGSSYYLLDRVHARMEFPEQVRQIKAMAKRWPDAHEIFIEKKANGAAVIAEIKHDVSGIVPVTPIKDKVTRANEIIGLWDAENIYVPHPKFKNWIVRVIDEWTGFPNMEHDDEVDAMTQALKFANRNTRSFGVKLFKGGI